ncbi:MAG: hypothetical protein GXP34_05940 [Actinobacteria bacterium]|nr:hypothetical protein [Actinomycetota bacterium]
MPLVTGPNVPQARAGTEIPWDEVGDGWHVVLYNASRANPIGPEDVEERSVLAYMVSPDATLYQAVVWAPGTGPDTIADLAGTHLLVIGSTGDGPLYQVADLRDGSKTTIRVPGTGLLDGPWPPVGLTRPTGKNMIVWGSDGTTEWLERRALDGTVLARVSERPYTGWAGTFSWLYGYAGLKVVIGHGGELASVRTNGEPLRTLMVPDDRICEPVRWWDADTVLARCSSAEGTYGYYFQLWLIPSDGTPGVALTSLPPSPEVVDFGYVDAWPAGGQTLLQWTGDCGASNVQILQPDGTGIGLETPWMEGIDGYRLVDVVGGIATIQTWRGCDAWEGSLDAIGLDGALIRHLVPIVGDARGVIDSAGPATVYP